MKTFREAIDGVMKNADRINKLKDGIGAEYIIDGKKIQVIVDKDLPTTYILAQIDTLLDDKKKEIMERM